MIPYGFLFSRLNQRYQEEPMTCKTPCAKCTCVKSTSPYDSDYTEIDASPMATLQQRYIADLVNVQEKASYWDVFCTTDPSAPECKVHDN